MFLSTIDHEARSFSARTKPIDGLWMTDHKLKSVMLCEPQYKNDYGKVFGGVIMEKCVDLAFSNTWVYTGLGKFLEQHLESGLLLENYIQCRPKFGNLGPSSLNLCFFACIVVGKVYPQVMIFIIESKLEFLVGLVL